MLKLCHVHPYATAVSLAPLMPPLYHLPPLCHRCITCTPYAMQLPSPVNGLKLQSVHALIVNQRIALGPP